MEKVKIASLTTRSRQRTPSRAKVRFYARELLGQRDGRRLDLGQLDSPGPLTAGMDRMAARTWWGRFLVDYASKACLHGLNHLAAPRRHPCERVLLGLSILGALGGLIAISLDSWYRYQHESTMLVLDMNFRKFEIEKPSITICPINYIDQEKFPQVFQRHKVKDTPATRKFLLSLANLTYGNMRYILDGEFEAVAPDTWLRLLYELRADVELASQYADEFTWISTERGLCLTVATPLADYSAVEYWLSNKLPIASAKSRKRSYFNVNNYGVVESIGCRSHDFWLSVHYPNTLIEYTSPGRIIRKMTLNTLTLGIVEVNSSERVRRLTVRQRNCKLHEDGGLKIWPVYTSSMCRLECRFNEIRRKCGCYPHFVNPLKKVAVCTARQLKSCVAKQMSNLIQLREEKLKSCGCLDDCNTALYIDKESTSFALKVSSPPSAVLNLNLDFPKIKFIREELFGFTEFLASMGGAAGLFLGASVLSACEIIYFASLRLFWFSINEKRKRIKLKRLLQAK